MKKLLDEFGVSESQVRKMLLARKSKKPKVLTRFFTNKEFRFGVVSDTHLCSTHEKLNELHTFYAICKKVGVKHVFHAGDLVAGWGIYFGQENEVHTFGAAGQADYVIRHYPKIEGITTYFITGNHCLSFFKRSGVDIGELVVAKRPDMIYLGQCQGDVEVNGIKFRLLHPDGGGAYAISYRGQKIAEQIPSGQKPDVLMLGHYHVSNYFWYRNMHILNCGSFEGQTLFLLRKGINPAIGGWICTAKKGNGRDRVLAFETSWVPFFEGG